MSSKRSSICSLLTSGLKRKRYEEEEEEEQCKRQKKSSVVLDLIQRVIRPKRKKRKEPVVVFDDCLLDLKLPVIEWTNGDLGIFLEEEDSIFCISTMEYIEFPKPPNLTRIEEDSDEEDLPLTPTLSLLQNQIEKLNLS